MPRCPRKAVAIRFYYTMKTITSVKAAIIALALPVAVFAQALGVEGTPGATSVGNVSTWKILNDPNTLFNALDDNRDSGLSQAEFSLIMDPTQETTLSSEIESLFKSLDSNTDSIVSRYEFQKVGSMTDGIVPLTPGSTSPRSLTPLSPTPESTQPDSIVPDIDITR